MVRQYKAMQEQLGKRVADLEAQNKGLREGARLKDEQIAKLQVMMCYGLWPVAYEERPGRWGGAMTWQSMFVHALDTYR